MWLYEVTDNQTFCGLKLCDDLVWWQYDSLKFLLIFDVNEYKNTEFKSLVRWIKQENMQWKLKLGRV